MGAQKVVVVKKNKGSRPLRDQTAGERRLVIRIQRKGMSDEGSVQDAAGGEACTGKGRDASFLHHDPSPESQTSPFPFVFTPSSSPQISQLNHSLTLACNLSVPNIDSVVCFEIMPMGLYLLDKK